MTDTAAFWDRSARKYAARPVKDMGAYEKTLDRVRAHLSVGDEVLETGCGTGTTALKLADAAGRITATDISAGMIAIGREKAAAQDVANIEFRQATLEQDMPAGPFDAVLAFNLLHLLTDPADAIDRVRNLVRPGGLFISKTVCLGRRAWHFRALIGGLQLIGKAPHVSFLDVAELEAMVTGAGFEIIETGDYPAKPPSHFIVARRPAQADPEGDRLGWRPGA
ncbi:MAG: hypothetical protein TEF_20145 [Rhizobiales bacterium NRL2]|nr:MAG: hypothetical protein TEF_20145 [Rhizobiales bacterium NRL2]